MVLRHQWLDNGHTHLEVRLVEMVSHLWLREVGPLDLGVHGCTRRVMLQHAEARRFQRRGGFQARLASAA